MLKRIEIAGIGIDNYTVRENILRLERRRTEKPFLMLQEITMDMIIRATKDPQIASLLSELDFSVISDPGILLVANEKSVQRMYEVKNHEFFHEFMKRAIRNYRTIFVLGDTEEGVMEMKEYLREEYPKMRIAGSAYVDVSKQNTDDVVNEINVAAPSIVLSILPSPTQEYFLLENRTRMCTQFWYGVGKYKFDKGNTIWKRIKYRLRLKKLHWYNKR